MKPTKKKPGKKSSGRQLAVEALLRVEQNQSWSNLTLDHMLEQSGLDSREGALATALFYGTLERRLTLDACVAAHSQLALAKIAPAVRQILRISLYQLLYMDKIPAHSAVDEGVQLTKTMGLARASGFVNGVLRAFLRADCQIPMPEGPVERLSVQYATPVPLVQLWLDSYGPVVTESVLQASLGRPPVHIRVNTLKTTAEDLQKKLAEQSVEATLHPTVPQCLSVSGQGAIYKLPAYAQGLFHVQDAASQLCVLALDAAPGMRVLDTCAAPGGKAFTMAQYMANQGTLIAAELHPRRVSLMEKQAARLGITCLTGQERDMTIPHPDLTADGLFDRVLCDVPCSGLGVIRRKPEIKYKDLAEFAHLPDIQYKILCQAAQYCKPGGRLVYSTCTLNPAENSAVTQQFLHTHPQFAPAPLPDLLGGDWEYTLTGDHDGDHFYVAAFTPKE